MLDSDTIAKLHAEIKECTKRCSGSEIVEMEKKIYHIASSHLDAIRKIKNLEETIERILDQISGEMLESALQRAKE